MNRNDWKSNKWKTYSKDENKFNKVKYFKIDKNTELQLLKYAKTTWLSQSKVIKDALIYYFNH